jgi:tetratricopeptide (TPR) repeat protein
MSEQPNTLIPSLAASCRRRFIVCGMLAGAVVVGFLALWLGNRQPRVPPPLPDLTDADPEVVEAISTARKGVEQTPSSGQAWGHLGMVLMAHGFMLECDLCFTQAERLSPKEPRWSYLQGVRLLSTEPETGIACLQRAVEHCKDAPLAPRLRLMEALLNRGRLPEAEQHLRQVLARHKNHPQARLGLGRLAFLRGEWREALTQLAACANDVHTCKQARTLSAQVRRRLGEEKQASAEAEQAEELPEDASWPDPFMDEVDQLQRGLPARIRQASALVSVGQSMQALSLIQETAAKYPQSVKVWLALGGLWFDTGRLDRAEQCFLKAVVVDPDAAEGWFRLGCLQALDRPREAAESFRRVLRLRPDHTLAHFNLGHRLKQLGDTAGAAREFRAALRSRPDYEPARVALQELERARK